VCKIQHHFATSYYVILTWFIPCHSRWNIVHRPLVSIQLCLVLPPPSSSSCTCILLSVHISFSRSLFHVFLGGRCLHVWPGGVQCSTCLVMLSSFLLKVCPRQLHLLLHIWSSTGSWPVFSHNSLLAVLSGLRILSILRRHLLMKTCSLSYINMVSINRHCFGKIGLTWSNWEKLATPGVTGKKWPHLE